MLVSHTANVSGFADEWLAEIGRKRHVVLSVPQYSALPALLAGTDLIASLPDYTAAAMAASGQLFKEPFPFKTPTLDLSMVWLSHVDTDPAERVNLATDPAHAATLAKFAAEADSRWNLPAFDAAVRESQARRWVVYEALRNGAYYPWDHQPLRAASERYMRNHMDLNVLEENKRFPRGE